MTLVQFLAEHPQHPHPGLSILFTPDEEIGRGADHVDIKKLDAAYGYTVTEGFWGNFPMKISMLQAPLSPCMASRPIPGMLKAC